MFAAAVQTQISFRAQHWIKKLCEWSNYVCLYCLCPCRCCTCMNTKYYSYGCFHFRFYSSCKWPLYTVVKQQKLDVTNWICVKLEQKTAGNISARIKWAHCCFVHWLLGIMQPFLYCSQHTKLPLCETEELFALWALLFCSYLTQSKTIPKPTVHGELKQILNCLDFGVWQVF